MPMPTPTPPAARAALASVDAAAVASLRSLRPGKQTDLYGQLVQLFRVGSSRAMAQLRDELAREDYKAATATCHKLAPSAANVGALAFAQDVRLLGQRCLAGDAPAASQLHDALQSAHPALLDALVRAQLRDSA
jgi:HPt (histidine-containing phosphotransfer) domain-containing protein